MNQKIQNPGGPGDDTGTPPTTTTTETGGPGNGQVQPRTITTTERPTTTTNQTTSNKSENKTEAKKETEKGTEKESTKKPTKTEENNEGKNKLTIETQENSGEEKTTTSEETKIPEENKTTEETTTTEQTPVTPTQTTTTEQAPVTTEQTTVPYPTSESETVRYGGEYSETDGYVPVPNEETGIIEEQPIQEPTPEPTPETPIQEPLDDAGTTLDDIVKKSKYSKIPSSSTPIANPTKKSSGSSVIPIAAGLTAAAAAGIGAKAYIDRKKNNENGEDDFESDEWSDDSMEIDYNEKEGEATLDAEDDYSYQSMEQEKYGARNSEELADLQ